jgi:ecotin
MAVDPNAPKVDQFIALGGEPYIFGYNSRLPVVVYVPKGWGTLPDMERRG